MVSPKHEHGGEHNIDERPRYKNLPTQIGARTICINPETHYLYLPVADYDKAPAPTTENPHPRSSIKPGTFTILEIAP